MRKLFIVLFGLALVCPGWSQKNIVVTLNDLTKVTKTDEGGLYFAGTKDVNYRFGKRISPHGDCIDVINGYAFVTWYKGGMDKRNLMLSRKNLTIENSPWVTIQFPHQHVGQRGELFNGTGIRGDSHNTAAIGISTIDNTIHIIYDMHAYSKSELPTVFFNYSVSKKDMAFVPDNEFTLEIFNAKITYLKEGQNYERLTYPMIHRADDGSLVTRYRKGGSGNGDILMAHYDGTSWSNNWIYHEGTLDLPNRNNMYGGERFLNGKFYSGFSIRYSTNNSTSTSNGYMLNSGLYFAYTNEIPKNNNSQWFDVNDKPITLPIKNNIDPTKDPVQIGQPGDDFGTATFPRSSSDPAWTVTENGTIHFVQRVDNSNVHYYKKATDANFSKNAGGLVPNPDTRGEIYSYKNHVFMVELINGKVIIKTTLEGTNNWKIVYSGTDSVEYSHFDAFVVEDKLYVYLMEDIKNNTVGVGDKRPLYFQEFTLSEMDTPPIEEVEDIIVEAEDYTSASVDISVAANGAASNGKLISPFSGAQWLEYKFQVTTTGVYDFILTAANRNRDDSTMDIEINGVLYNNVLITRSFDWNVFLETKITGVTLNEGENVVKITQNKSLSSTPDKFKFVLTENLSTEKLGADMIGIFPNPSNGVFNIETSFASPYYMIFDLKGKVLEDGVLHEKRLNLKNYPKGVCFLKLYAGNVSLVRKLIIK
ncbi:BNR-4 repeat-containing protein [Bacteroidota bacterium]